MATCPHIVPSRGASGTSFNSWFPGLQDPPPQTAIFLQDLQTWPTDTHRHTHRQSDHATTFVTTGHYRYLKHAMCPKIKLQKINKRFAFLSIKLWFRNVVRCRLVILELLHVSNHCGRSNMVQSESIKSTSGLQLPLCTLSACEFIQDLRDDTKYEVFLNLRKKLSAVSSFAVKWARHAKKTPDDFSSRKVMLSSKQQFKISTYLVVNSSKWLVSSDSRRIPKCKKCSPFCLVTVTAWKSSELPRKKPEGHLNSRGRTEVSGKFWWKPLLLMTKAHLYHFLVTVPTWWRALLLHVTCHHES